MTFPSRAKELLRPRGAQDIMVIGGGTIPEADIRALKEKGWAREIFTPGTSLDTIVKWIQANVRT